MKDVDLQSKLEFGGERLCRLCLQDDGDMVHIFDPKGYNGFRVWEIIKELLQLEVSKEDGLPGTICWVCLKKVIEFKQFKTLCIQSKISVLTNIACRGIVSSCGIQVATPTSQGHKSEEKNAFVRPAQIESEDELTVLSECIGTDDSANVGDSRRSTSNRKDVSKNQRRKEGSSLHSPSAATHSHKNKDRNSSKRSAHNGTEERDKFVDLVESDTTNEASENARVSKVSTSGKGSSKNQHKKDGGSPKTSSCTSHAVKDKENSSSKKSKKSKSERRLVSNTVIKDENAEKAAEDEHPSISSSSRKEMDKRKHKKDGGSPQASSFTSQEHAVKNKENSSSKKSKKSKSERRLGSNTVLKDENAEKAAEDVHPSTSSSSRKETNKRKHKKDGGSPQASSFTSQEHAVKNKENSSSKKSKKSKSERRLGSNTVLKDENAEKAAEDVHPSTSSSSRKETNKRKHKKFSTERPAKIARLGVSPRTVAIIDIVLSDSETEEEVDVRMPALKTTSGERGNKKAAKVPAKESVPKKISKHPKVTVVDGPSTSAAFSTYDEAMTQDTERNRQQSVKCLSTGSKGQKSKEPSSRSVQKPKNKAGEKEVKPLKPITPGAMNFIEVPVREDVISSCPEATGESILDPLATIKVEPPGDGPLESPRPQEQRRNVESRACYDYIYSNLRAVKEEPAEAVEPVSDNPTSFQGDSGMGFAPPRVVREPDIEMEFEEHKYSAVLLEDANRFEKVAGGQADDSSIHPSTATSSDRTAQRERSLECTVEEEVNFIAVTECDAEEVEWSDDYRLEVSVEDPLADDEGLVSQNMSPDEVLSVGAGPDLQSKHSQKDDLIASSQENQLMAIEVASGTFEVSKSADSSAITPGNEREKHPGSGRPGIKTNPVEGKDRLDELAEASKTHEENDGVDVVCLTPVKESQLSTPNRPLSLQEAPSPSKISELKHNTAGASVESVHCGSRVQDKDVMLSVAKKIPLVVLERLDGICNTTYLIKERMQNRSLQRDDFDEAARDKEASSNSSSSDGEEWTPSAWDSYVESSSDGISDDDLWKAEKKGRKVSREGSRKHSRQSKNSANQGNQKLKSMILGDDSIALGTDNPSLHPQEAVSSPDVDSSSVTPPGSAPGPGNNFGDIAENQVNEAMVPGSLAGGSVTPGSSLILPAQKPDTGAHITTVSSDSVSCSSEALPFERISGAPDELATSCNTLKNVTGVLQGIPILKSGPVQMTQKGYQLKIYFISASGAGPAAVLTPVTVGTDEPRSSQDTQTDGLCGDSVGSSLPTVIGEIPSEVLTALKANTLDDLGTCKGQTSFHPGHVESPGSPVKVVVPAARVSPWASEGGSDPEDKGNQLPSNVSTGEGVTTMVVGSTESARQTNTATVESIPSVVSIVVQNRSLSLAGNMSASPENASSIPSGAGCARSTDQSVSRAISGAGSGSDRNIQSPTPTGTKVTVPIKVLEEVDSGHGKNDILQVPAGTKAAEPIKVSTSRACVLKASSLTTGEAIPLTTPGQTELANPKTTVILKQLPNAISGTFEGKTSLAQKDENATMPQKHVVKGSLSDKTSNVIREIFGSTNELIDSVVDPKKGTVKKVLPNPPGSCQPIAVSSQPNAGSLHSDGSSSKESASTSICTISDDVHTLISKGTLKLRQGNVITLMRCIQIGAPGTSTGTAANVELSPAVNTDKLHPKVMSGPSNQATLHHGVGTKAVAQVTPKPDGSPSDTCGNDSRPSSSSGVPSKVDQTPRRSGQAPAALVQSITVLDSTGRTSKEVVGIRCKWCSTKFTSITALTNHINNTHRDVIAKMSRISEEGESENVKDSSTRQRSIGGSEKDVGEAEASGTVQKATVECIEISDDEMVERVPPPPRHYKCKYCPEHFTHKSVLKDHKELFHGSRYSHRKGKGRCLESGGAAREDRVAGKSPRQVQHVPPFYVSPRSIYMNTPGGASPTQPPVRSSDPSNPPRASRDISGVSGSLSGGKESPVSECVSGGSIPCSGAVIPEGAALNVPDSTKASDVERVSGAIGSETARGILDRAPGTEPSAKSSNVEVIPVGANVSGNGKVDKAQSLVDVKKGGAIEDPAKCAKPLPGNSTPSVTERSNSSLQKLENDSGKPPTPRLDSEVLVNVTSNSKDSTISSPDTLKPSSVVHSDTGRTASPPSSSSTASASHSQASTSNFRVIFKCPLCRLSYSNISGLQKHLIAFHEVPKSDVLNKITLQPTVISVRSSGPVLNAPESDDTNVNCSMCDKKFLNLSARNEHFAKVHVSQLYERQRQRQIDKLYKGTGLADKN